jgi:hypothetical protein
MMKEEPIVVYGRSDVIALSHSDRLIWGAEN